MATMPGPSVSDTIAAALRTACDDAGWTHRELARRLGTNPSAIKRLLAGGAASLDVGLATAALSTLGLRMTIDRGGLGLAGRSRQRDAVHAWCCAFIVRVLEQRRFAVRVEVEIGDGRTRGWIDILAYRSTDRTLLCIEVKTEIDDAGRTLRQLGWNVRSSREAARGLGWQPLRIVPVLLVLSTSDVEERLLAAGPLIRNHLPGDVSRLSAFLEDPAAPSADPTVGLIDPRRRGARWLIRPRFQGGRTRPPYRDYADAAARITPGRRPRSPPRSRRPADGSRPR